MTKIQQARAWLLGVLFILVSATGCEEPKRTTVSWPDPRGSVQPYKELESFRTDYDNGNYSTLEVREVLYRSHKYLAFRVQQDCWSLVHDPDCPCFRGEPLPTTKVEEDLEDRWKSLWD